MNAPFQARAGLRDPFTAFVCDDATADMLRPVAVEHGWSPEKVNKGGLRNAVQSLSVSASPNILFVDLSESADPLNDINALAEVCEPGTIVIAAGTVNDVRLYRDLVASGIHDYLLKPFTVDQLRDTFAHAQMILSGPRGEAQADKPHVMAAVIGVRGGVGASTIATSLAWLLGEKAHRSTALLDLDVHFGTGALALDLEPGRGLTDAIENPSRIDGLFIERVGQTLSDGIAALGDLVLQPDVRRFVAADEDAGDGDVTAKCRPLRLEPEHIEHHDCGNSKNDWQDEAGEDDEEGEILGADAGLHQLLLRLLDLVVLQHPELRQDRAHAVCRLVAVPKRLALVRRGDDAGLELLAALVERFHAPSHRVLDGGRGVNGEHHREGRDGAEHRRDPDDVEAEDMGAGGWRSLHGLNRLPQISKLTILAMMAAPMPIHTMPPRPATISR
jgi:CheY-like chemotaxis protein